MNGTPRKPTGKGLLGQLGIEPGQVITYYNPPSAWVFVAIAVMAYAVLSLFREGF